MSSDTARVNAANPIGSVKLLFYFWDCTITFQYGYWDVTFVISLWHENGSGKVRNAMAGGNPSRLSCPKLHESSFHVPAEILSPG